MIKVIVKDIYGHKYIKDFQNKKDAEDFQYNAGWNEEIKSATILTIEDKQ